MTLSMANQKSAEVIIVLKDLGYFLSHRADLARFLMGRGKDVSLVTDLQGRTNFALHAALSDVIDLPFTNITSSPWKILMPTLRLARKLASNRKAIAFSVTLPATLLVGLLCLITGNRHVILFAGLGNVFNGTPNPVRRIIRSIVKLITRKPRTRIIAQNEEIRQFLSQNGYSKYIALIPGSGIDANQYTHAERPHAVNNPIKILFFGRMLREKGVQEFIDAAKLTIKKGFDAEFILAGRTDPINPTSLRESELNAMLAGSDKIRWIGHCADVLSLLKSVDVVCLPSYHEGFPRALLEGALMGCCLVATDIPGCRDIIEHEKTGLLVNPKSAEDLCRAFIVLLSNPDKISQFAETARLKVIENFTNEKILPQYEAVLCDSWN